MATFIEKSLAEIYKKKLLWLLFPTRVEELSFFEKFESKKQLFVAGIPFKSTDLIGASVHSFVTGVGVESVHFCNRLIDLIANKEVQMPDFVLLAGFAGGCKKKHKTGDVFIIKSIMHESREILLDEIQFPDAFFLNQSIVSQGVGVCVDHIANSDEKKKFGLSGADLVEMEYFGVRSVFLKINLPVYCIRVILDDSEYSIPEKISKCLNGGKVSLLPLFQLIILNPMIAVILVQLALKSSVAKKKLLMGLTLLTSTLAPKN